ncbi:MAG: hypothetical protein HY954_01590 [Deltaproteobacteria bacterium]|nr:hypothetical protein [Deltaproteobacteria bacterium]
MNLKLAFLFWFVMVVIAIINGVFSEFVVSKALGDYGSHLYRTFFAIAVIFIASRIYLKVGYPGGYFTPAIYTGILWVCLSLTFEFGFGHYVFKMPLEKIILEYRIQEGRLWSLVIASEFLAPLANAWLLSSLK